MKQLIVLTFLLLNFSVLCQNHNSVSKATEGTYLVESDFQKAKILYAEMVSTEVFLTYFKALNEFTANLNGEHSERILEDEYWSNWIAENLQKTKFKSVEEANLAYHNLNKKAKLQSLQHSNVYSLLKVASIDQKIEIMEPFFNLQLESAGKSPKP